jgi:hypothetical protein
MLTLITYIDINLPATSHLIADEIKFSRQTFLQQLFSLLLIKDKNFSWTDSPSVFLGF